MSEALQLVPLDAIDAGALIRDRIPVDAEAMGELKASIAAGGVRMPVEVFALEAPAGRFGLPRGCGG
jgi:ParB family transcriptional regulator, chromosome partitioning protein